MVLCLLKNVRSGFCISSVGGSPAPLIALRLRFAAGLPPTIRIPSSWLYRSTLAFHSSGGLTRGHATCQFIPFDPFLPDGMLWVVLPHKVFLPGRDAVSFMDIQERSGESCLTYRSGRSNMSLKVPGRAGACTDMAERQSYHPPIPGPQRAPHEDGNGAPGLPRTVHESAKPPPEGRALPTLPQKSALSRAVERTRNLYERNGWTFLPLGEAAEHFSGIPTLRRLAKINCPFMSLAGWCNSIPRGTCLA
jgi:hypothetical protein